ncbi:sporulation-specific transcription factor SpoVIF [Lentibacillus kapialis]|uniref:Sporulation-specific transcription factor SpoVIF n=1 Tax=Lentibacillus kapialis TaxID=340214 RepID=A0A917PNU7_9BACI|nr:stage VI sporulation protein F [Lentibacillus kapialis]GGJ85738.1 sporulation-specific transcription factor SpoVIF [Lentibacillus kapialis]
MSNFQDNLFDKVQQNSDISPNDIYKMADSVKNADFSDEKTVRNLVQRLSKLANKPISKAKEDKIVESITKSNMPVDMQTLNKMFKK